MSLLVLDNRIKSYKMKGTGRVSYQKLGVGALLIISIGIAISLGQLLQPDGYSVNSENWIAYSAASSPALSGLFVNFDVYLINADFPHQTIRVTRQLGTDSMPSLAPQLDRIVYTRIEGLYVVNLDSLHKSELLRPGLGRGTISSPAWSPDGSKIAFSEGEIYVLDVKTGQTTQLTDGSIPTYQPAWSPDGERIAFTLMPFLARPGGGRPDSYIAVINADGSNLVPLTPNNGSGSPAWSPDGSQIAFHRNGNIYVMNADGANVRMFTRDGKSILPTWSPDGTRIAFVSSKNSRCGPAPYDSPPFCTSELYIMNADGSNITAIRSKSNERVDYPAWGPGS